MPMPPPLGRFTSPGPPEPSADYQVLVVETIPVLEDAILVVEAEVVPYLDDDRPTIDELVELTRLERELRRASAHERYAVVAIEPEPEPWFASTWARVSACALVGYALGRSPVLRTLAAVAFGAALVTRVDRALAHTAPAPAGW